MRLIERLSFANRNCCSILIGIDITIEVTGRLLYLEHQPGIPSYQIFGVLITGIPPIWIGVDNIALIFEEKGFTRIGSIL